MSGLWAHRRVARQAQLKAAPVGQGRTGDRGDEELLARHPRYGYRLIPAFVCASRHRSKLVAQASAVAPGGPVPKQRSRERIAPTRPRVHTPFKANMVWADDFVFDTVSTDK